MNNDLISRSALRARYQEILDRGDMFCEYDIIGMVDNAPAVDVKPFATVTFDKDELDRIVEERVIDPIKNGELVIKEERPTGHWKASGFIYSRRYAWCICSNCGKTTRIYLDDNDFCCIADIRKKAIACLYCGADMRGDER